MTNKLLSTIVETPQRFLFFSHFKRLSRRIPNPTAAPLTLLATHSKGKFPFGESAQIENVKCGLKGCGFMQIGGYMVRSNKLVAWVERLLPNPPPRNAVGDPPSAYLGWELVEFDVSTGNATGIRPFRLDSNNATGPEPLGTSL